MALHSDACMEHSEMGGVDSKVLIHQRESRPFGIIIASYHGFLGTVSI